MNSLISTLHRAAGLSGPVARRPLRRSSQLLSLEQRFMFDGAVVAAAAAGDSAHAAQAHDAAAAAATVPPAVTVRAADPAKDEGKKEVVLVDTSVANYKALEAGVREGVGIVEFDGSGDGLAQIAQWAATQSGYDAIHILSHGDVGTLNLGTTHLSAASLGDSTVQTELAQLGSALNTDGDLLLYACDTGNGSAGAALVDGLARATGADVAASTDLTGAASLGGNWTLERHSGTIDVASLALTSYDGLLVIAPPSTSIATAKFSSDTGTSDTDFVTNTAAQTISGTLSATLLAGETVNVSLDNGASWITASSSVGSASWSLAGVTLSGSSTLRIAVVDASGNFGPVFAHSYSLDTTAPSSSVTGLQSVGNNSGSSGFLTNDDAQTISGTITGGLAVGDVLYASLDGGSTWRDITSSVSGTTLNWTNATLLSGTHTLLLKVTDAAGNDGAILSQTYTLDQTPPDKPSAPTLDASTDSGISTSDGVTNNSTPIFTGTAESGSNIFLYADNGNFIGATTATAGGAWTIFSFPLSEGIHNIRVTATDAAGNTSILSDGTLITIDTTAPTVSSMSVPANATYAFGTSMDFTVNYNESVYVDTNGGTPRIALVVGSTTRYATYVSGSGTGALTFRYTVDSGDVDNNGITIGAMSLNGATVRDAAGNDATTTLNSVGSTAAVLVDGTQISVTGVSATSTDGSYGPGATVQITVDFSGAVSVTGTPLLSLSSGGTANYLSGSGTGTLTFAYTVQVGENSADLDYSSTSALSLNGGTIVDAHNSYGTALLSLAAPGSAGSLGSNKDIVIDTVPPSITASSVSFTADTGTYNNDLITKTAAQTIDGRLDTALGIGDFVEVSLDNGNTWTRATTATGDSWSLTNVTLAGSNTLKVRVVDAAGNRGASTSFAYVLDTTAPTTTFSNIAFSNDTGFSQTDLVTNTSAQTISATLSNALVAGDIVYGSLDNGNSWTDITSKVSGTTLSWNTVTLGGSDTLQLRVTDVAGNNGVVTSRAYVLDTTGPSTSIASVEFSNDSGSSHTDFITNVAAQTIRGTLTANLGADERVYVSLDNGASWVAATAAVNTDTWSLAGRTLSSSNTLLVKVSDSAGNDGTVLSQAYVFVTGTSAHPVVTALQTPSLTPILTGTVSLAAGDTMTVSVGGATYDVVPVAGSWSLDLATAVPTSGTLTLVLNNRYDVVATVTDLAGNIGHDTTSGELIVGQVASTSPTTAPPPLPLQTQLPPGLPPLGQFAPLPTSVLPDFTPVTPLERGPLAWNSAVLPSPIGLDVPSLADARTMPFGRGDLLGSDGVLLVNATMPNLDLAGNGPISFSLPANAFSFAGSGDLQLSAAQADGRPLPAWLRFDARTGKFEGQPPAGFSGTLRFSVAARDAQGHVAIQTFNLEVGARGIDAQRSEAVPTRPVPVGRAGLAAQLGAAREHQAALHLDHLAALGRTRQPA